MDLSARLGTSLAIIQAPMAGVQDHRLAVAVASAGGLGSLPCAMLDVDAISREVQAFRARTNSPLNLNFFCHRAPEPDAGKENTWRNLLSRYYREYEISGQAILPGAQRRPFDGTAAALVEECRPEIVSFHFGLPADDLLRRVKVAGATVLSSATTVTEAQWLERRGADAIIAQGLEAGGHRGHFLSNDLNLQSRAFDLLLQVVQAVNIPVIAAGGLGTPQAIARAMALGAAAVQIGTVYLLCPEATTSAVHRRALEESKNDDTVLTNLFSGRPARGIANRLIRELGPINAAVPDFPLAASALGPLRTAAEARGRSDFSPLWAGRGVTTCRAQPAGELTLELASHLT